MLESAHFKDRQQIYRRKPLLHWNGERDRVGMTWDDLCILLDRANDPISIGSLALFLLFKENSILHEPLIGRLPAGIRFAIFPFRCMRETPP